MKRLIVAIVVLVVILASGCGGPEDEWGRWTRLGELPQVWYRFERTPYDPPHPQAGFLAHFRNDYDRDVWLVLEYEVMKLDGRHEMAMRELPVPAHGTNYVQLLEDTVEIVRWRLLEHEFRPGPPIMI
jgi:hypothetical protein